MGGQLAIDSQDQYLISSRAADSSGGALSTAFWRNAKSRLSVVLLVYFITHLLVAVYNDFPPPCKSVTHFPTRQQLENDHCVKESNAHSRPQE